MASLWQHPESRYWFACYRESHGRRVKVSTKCTERKEAQLVADRLELEARVKMERRGREASLPAVTDNYQRAVQLIVSGRMNAAKMRDLLNEVMVATGQEPIDSISSSKWCEDWQASKNGAVKQRSQWKYKQVCRDWLAFLNGKAVRPLEAVSKTDVVGFRDRLATDGLAKRTVNQTIKLLRCVYQDAVEQGHIGRNPFAGVDALREDDDGTSREPFTVADVEALLDAAEGDWHGMITLAATTGLRLMDAARLQWRNIDAPARLIRIKTAKTGANLSLPIHADFSAWLSQQTRGIGAAPVFPSLADKGGAGKSGLSSMFKRLMERAGVSAGVARKAGENARGRTTSKKSFHSLRSFVATQLAQAKVRQEIARAITGHADAATHANYITADEESLRSAVDGIKLSA